MKLSLALTLSLVAHFLITTAVTLYSQWNPEKSLAPVEIVYVNPPENLPKNPQTFVPHLPVPEKLKFDDNSEAQFASQEKVRVLLETQAREKGLTKNRVSGPKFLQPFQDEISESSEQKNKFDLKDPDGFKVFDPKKELAQLNQMPSTVSVALPDNIALGSMTTLNTDRHLFYSFYSRLESRTYPRWSDLVHKTFESYPPTLRKKLFGSRKLTPQVIILLKPNGEFHRAEFHSIAGIKKLDMTSSLAFQEARIFPNPPMEMIRPDGFIHISASFTVDFRPVQ